MNFRSLMGLNSNGVQKVNNTCKFITALTLHYQIWGERNKPRPFPLPGTVISGTIISQNHVPHFMKSHGRNSGFPGGSDRKESACNVERPDSIPGLGRFPGGGHDNPLCYSCLENPHGQRNLVGYSPWGCREWT